MTSYQHLALISALISIAAAVSNQPATTAVMAALALITSAIGAWRD